MLLKFCWPIQFSSAVDLYSALQLHLKIKPQMLLTVIVQIRKCWVVQRNTVKNNYELYLDITNILVVFPQIRYSTEVFDITNPRYNEKISPVPWHFVKSRFHCI